MYCMSNLANYQEANHGWTKKGYEAAKHGCFDCKQGGTHWSAACRLLCANWWCGSTSKKAECSFDARGHQKPHSIHFRHRLLKPAYAQHAHMCSITKWSGALFLWEVVNVAVCALLQPAISHTRRYNNRAAWARVMMPYD